MIDGVGDGQKQLLERARSTVAALAAQGAEEYALDSAVHDAASEAASEANNAGVEAQVEYLMRNGWKPEDILFRAKQDG